MSRIYKQAFYLRYTHMAQIKGTTKNERMIILSNKDHNVVSFYTYLNQNIKKSDLNINCWQVSGSAGSLRYC